MLLFLLLVFLPAVPIETEVVRNWSDCPGFFVNQKPPEISNILVGGNILNQTRYKFICQTFGNMTRFLTLYDTKNKIPVFSAYRFTGAQPGRPTGDIWKIEPQSILANKYTPKNQATNSDYSNDQGYQRGHLYPNSHAPDWDAKLSTFTLTNAVPQVGTFNGGKWAQVEKRTKCYMENNCINASGKIEAFVVTGAEPGNERLNNKINITSKMWSAFCCHNSREGVWYSKAYWGDNVPNSNWRESSYKEMKTKFGIKIFPVNCSFLNNVDSSRTHPCEKEYPFQSEITTDTAPPSTTDKTSPAEKTTFPPNSTPASPMMPKTTTTLAAATKTTQPTSITSRYTSVINEEDCEDDEETNRKRRLSELFSLFKGGMRHTASVNMKVLHNVKKEVCFSSSSCLDWREIGGRTHVLVSAEFTHESSRWIHKFKGFCHVGLCWFWKVTAQKLDPLEGESSVRGADYISSLKRQTHELLLGHSRLKT
uniref:Uncharacterized protein n=1 Tax=Oryzias melastigma TaxID=30732 RepID=A0A3B3CWA7_ORYME